MSTTMSRKSGLQRRKAMTFYLLISPWLIGVLCFTVGPMLFSLCISFFRWDLISPAHFIGLGNYKQMFTMDPLFWKSLRVTLLYTVFSVPLGLAVALILAVLMNQKIPGIGVFRTIFYLPSVVSGVAISMLWLWIFNPDFGLVNGVLSWFGLHGPGWFSDPHWALATMVIISLYNLGGTAIIFLAGIKNIPVSLYEASELDGAHKWQQFIHVTIPLLTPTILFNLIMGLIGAFQVFTQGLVITAGGPDNATLFYNLYLYQNAFSYSKMGYASAMGWILFIITSLFSFVVMRTSNKWVYYEGDAKQ